MSNATTQFAADFQGRGGTFDMAAALRHALAEKRKSYGAQLMDIWRLGRGPGRLTPKDYYYFRLYDDAIYSAADRLRFASDRIHAGLIAKVCDRTWWAAADDKWLAYSLFSTHGIRAPETQAAHDRNGRHFGKLPTLVTRDDVAAFLSGPARYPLFAKPTGGIGSFGAFLIEGYDGGQVLLRGQAALPLDDFMRAIGEPQGYLFQTLLQPHPAIAAISPVASTVRVIVIHHEGRPQILHTIWKIPAAGSIADNFWRRGNMLAAIEPESGRVVRAIRGTGPALEELTHHPDSGVALVGAALPDWPALMSMCLDGARMFLPNRYQSWDIALCPEGPVAVEVNTGSAFNLSQLATGEGFLTDRFVDFCNANGYPIRLG